MNAHLPDHPTSVAPAVHPVGSAIGGEDAFSRFLAGIQVNRVGTDAAHVLPTDQAMGYPAFVPNTTVPRLLGHDRFTRLPCVVDFSDVLPGSVQGLQSPDWLGDVPARFSRLHRPEWAHALAVRLDWLLRHPVSTEVGRDGSKRVQVMGSSVLEVDEHGGLHGFAWETGPDDALVLARRMSSAHPLWTMGRPLDWLHPIQQGLVDEMFLSTTIDWIDRKTAMAYVNFLLSAWVRAHWTKQIHHEIALLERTTVTRFLSLDTALVAQAHAIWASAPHRFTLTDLEACRESQACDARMLAEAPQLVLLRCWLSSYLCPHTDRLQAMRDLLVASGVQPAMWALLQREGCEWMKAFMPYFNRRTAPELSEVVQVLTLAQVFGTRHLVPPALLHGFISLCCNPNAPRKDVVSNLDDMFGFAQRMGAAWARGSEAVREQMLSLSHDVFRWANREWALLDIRAQRHIGWTGIHRRVLQWQAACRASAMQGSSFSVPIDLTMNNPTWTAVVLDTHLAIWEEGYHMHHCAERFTFECAEGVAFMVSIRRTQDGKRLATVLLRKETDADGKTVVKVGQMSGPSNTLVGNELRREIALVAGQLQAWCDQQDAANGRLIPLTKRWRGIRGGLASIGHS